MAAPQEGVGSAPVVTRLRALLDEAVAAGALSTGSKIPTERALSTTLQASRAAVRAALGELERDGRITRHVGRGTFLTELEAEPGLPPAARGPLQTSPAEIMATRLVLEPEIAALRPRPTRSSRPGTPRCTAPSRRRRTTACCCGCSTR